MSAPDSQEGPSGPRTKQGLVSRIIAHFVDSDMAAILLIVTLLLGAAALMTTPREEEPQIVVPLADIHVAAPNLTREEVENLVAAPLERLCFQVDGVEHVYSQSRRGAAIVTVRFFVGENREDSFIKLQSRVAAQMDQVPPGVASWIVKPVEIDDVAVITLTLASDKLDDDGLRDLGEEVLADLERIPDISRTEIVGGQRREIVITPNAAAMAARGVTLQGLQGAVRAAATERMAGVHEREGDSVAVLVGERPRDASDLGDTVVATFRGAPVLLKEVATVKEQPGETDHLVRLRKGPSYERHPLRILRDVPEDDDGPLAAVTLSLSKKKGTNAVLVAEEVEAAMGELIAAGVVPDDVGVLVTRNLGVTADHKVDELVEALWVAIATVVALIAMVLGFREGFIVAVAVPVTFAITLFINQLFDYTINRVTLFALILSLGLVVDDPIVDVENIARHLGFKGKSRRQAVLDAVDEVRPPIILATLAVIVSFLPMFFITGMMGPYMAPMALNVPLAMISSLIVAFTITPWMSGRMLKARAEADGRELVTRSPLLRGYRKLMGGLMGGNLRSFLVLLVTAGLFLGSLLLPLLGIVPLKMLPFDNKDEFQVLVDLPEGSSLSRTSAVVSALEEEVLAVPEVTAVCSYVGRPSPLDFNGIVKHTYFRQGPHLADLRVNLAFKKERRRSTHHLVLAIRNRLTEVARTHGAVLKILETPPGPPVTATVTVEVRGRPWTPLQDLEASARQLATRLARCEGVVDVDTTLEAPALRRRIVVDERRAARQGLDEARIAAVVAAAREGTPLGTVKREGRRHPVPVRIRLPRERRSGDAELLALPVANRSGVPVRLAEVASMADDTVESTIQHKDTERIVYVFAETAGRAPAEVVLEVQGDLAEGAPLPGVALEWAGEGEWKITLDVFRDLGLAFGAALVMIYVLLLAQMKSYSIPLVVMASIPLTMIGIFPGFALLNLFFADGEVGGFGAPIYFTATAMIGMIALAGIVVRNAIILVEFVHKEQEAGRELRDALMTAGAVRLRPVLMTAGTTLLGAWPITLDPIFSGLAWALIFGLLASTAFTLVVIPVAYWLLYQPRGRTSSEA